jgi:hypothetical protein
MEYPADYPGQEKLVAGLRDLLQARAGSCPVQLIETHISYVLVAGAYAYKIKKAVRLAFLDFSTLAARRFYCEEELRLNRRHAPQIYLDVVAIKGSPETPRLGGDGPALEYAVRMRAFDQNELASALADRGALTAAHIDAIAARLAEFHRHAQVVATAGAPDIYRSALQRALDNCDEIRPTLRDPRDLSELERLRQWTQREHERLRDAFLRRARSGRVRECHGDLHLANVALIEGVPTFFDCIEFSASLRRIDVMSDAAFLAMDLEARGRTDLANRFLNAYLEATGDYEGLALLPFHTVYRALVRAKVACLDAARRTPVQPAELPAGYRAYLRCARAHAEPTHPALIITHGFSGCGKTTVTQGLLEQSGAIRLRSDVERKRLAGLSPGAQTRARVGGGLYTQDATEKTYNHLFLLAGAVLAAGYTVIVDATFLRRAQRDMFAELAALRRVPFAMLSFTAPEPALRQRILRRSRAGRDASEADLAVLQHQLVARDLLDASEYSRAVIYDAAQPVTAERLRATWRRLREHLDQALPADPGGVAAA